ncbi:S1 family peptidase [Nocardioides speluncae]|uniref:S1 family peptidase n=1 Tax=Nocardioides speluncae TaxID=2670337 RepID=UPI001F0B746B|nr:serine protease [Nocardioides speluncae]
MKPTRLAASLLGVVAAAAFAVPTAVPAAAQPASDQGAAAVTLASTIKLSNCSASLVRYPSWAMMLTNGHCYEKGFLAAGQVLVNKHSSRTGILLDANGGELGTLRADKVLYATMTGTDATLYRLRDTFASIQTKYGATPLTLSASRPADGIAITIPSGYWKRIWNCQVDGFTNLREHVWNWTDSIRYAPGCDTIGGTSGSPVVDNATGLVVGVNNTGNENGEMCTLNNPCEVAPDGTTTVRPGISYGQQTYWFMTCLDASRNLNLDKPGCLLPS